MKVVELIGASWPELTAVVLVVGVLALIGRYFLGEYRELLKETRATSSHLRTEIGDLRKDLSDARGRTQELAERVDALEGMVHTQHQEVQEYRAEVADWENSWKESATTLRVTAEGLLTLIKRLESETDALFMDRDRLKADLDLAWKAIMNSIPEKAGSHFALRKDELSQRAGRAGDSVDRAVEE